MRLPKKAYANGFVHAMLATEPLIGCTADKMFYPAVPAAIVSGQAKSIDVGGNPDTCERHRGQRASPEPQWAEFTLSFAFTLYGNRNPNQVNDGNTRATENVLVSKIPPSEEARVKSRVAWI
jgi:hypothetical protein